MSQKTFADLQVLALKNRDEYGEVVFVKKMEELRIRTEQEKQEVQAL